MRCASLCARIASAITPAMPRVAACRGHMGGHDRDSRYRECSGARRMGLHGTATFGGTQTIPGLEQRAAKRSRARDVGARPCSLRAVDEDAVMPLLDGLRVVRSKI